MEKKIILILAIISMAFVSCEKDKEESGEYADYLVAKPITISKEDFKSSTSIIAPKPIDESGKIYAYKNYIFVNDKYQGIHVIDNSNPVSPSKIAFIKIPGNVDISIKDDYLYADSVMDLIVLDISDIQNIKEVQRMENVLRNYVVFSQADFHEYGEIDYEKDIIVGWKTTTERRSVEEFNTRFGRDVIFAAELANSDASTVGQGGSLARFKIVDDFLYAVDSHHINVFDIQDLTNPKDLEDVYAGFDIETIFNKGEYLFLGSMRGMYIYDISAPATPIFVSEFEHGTACDPVVVDDKYAYVTLRGGNECGATESGLFIIDISDIERPKLTVSYPMDSPYGLGIKDEKLFVCDGDSGLKVYNKTNVEDLQSLNHFRDINTFDVIPLEESLLMVGDGVLYQYQYLSDSIKLLSTLQLQ